MAAMRMTHGMTPMSTQTGRPVDNFSLTAWAGPPSYSQCQASFVNTLYNYAIDKQGFLCYIITMKDIKDFIVTTANGTRWAATGASIADVRANFFGSKIGLKIANVEAGRLFTHEEEEDLRREKDIERCR